MTRCNGVCVKNAESINQALAAANDSTTRRKEQTDPCHIELQFYDSSTAFAGKCPIKGEPNHFADAELTRKLQFSER